MPYPTINSTVRSLKKYSANLMLILTSTASPLSAMAELEHSPHIEKAITTAMYQHDKALLKDLAESSKNYNQAYALYRLAQLNMPLADKAQTARSLNRAKAILENLENPTDPEVQVLKAGVLSLLMGVEPHGAGALVGEVQHAFNGPMEGATLARAQLLQGINLMYTPPAYGGSIDGAAELLKMALENFKVAPTSNVSWGEAEAYIWLGKARQQQGDLKAAKRALEQAIVVAPGCHWAAKELSELAKM